MHGSTTFRQSLGSIAAILAACALFGFAPTAMAGGSLSSAPYVTTVFDAADGLPQTSVKDILQTRDGYLWVATEEGLARFDGVKFTNYNMRTAPGLVSDDVHELVEDAGGAIWILAGSGVTRYRAGVFDNMTPQCDQIGHRINYLFKSPSGAVYAVSDSQFLRADANGLTPLASTQGYLTAGPWYFAQQPDGNLWISGGGRKILSVHGSTVRRYTLPGKTGDEIGGMAVDSEGALWVGDTGLWRFVDGRFTSYPSTGPWSTNHVDALSIAHDGVMWFTIKGLVYSLAPGAKAPRAWSAPAQSVRWTAFDPDGTIWQLLVNGSHNAIWSFQNGHVSQFDVPGWVTTEWTLPVRRSSEGNIWVGTYTGLVEFRRGRCRTYGDDAGLTGGATEIYQTQSGEIWVDAKGPTLGTLTNGRFQPTADPSLRSADVSSMADDGDGDLWVSTFDKHLWMRAPGKPAVDMISMIGGEKLPITGISRAPDGSIWCANGKRLSHIAHRRVVEALPLRSDPNAPPYVFVVRADRDGRVWIGDGKGFACLDHGKLTYFGAENGLPSVPVIDICEDHTGETWLAFWGGGLGRYRNGHVDLVTLRDGLFSDSIQSVIESNSDELWMGTSNGVFSVDRDSLDRYLDSGRTSTFTCRSYGREDGSSAVLCMGGRQPVAFRGHDGSLWFACYDGVIGVSTTAPAFDRALDLPVWIESAIVDDKSFAVDHKALARPGPGNLEFDYTAVTFQQAAKVDFRYRLDGFDQNWVDAGSRRVAYYTHVPPGSYRFEVIAGDAFGNLNRIGASFYFTIKPHYYETTWFRALIATLLLLLTSGVGISRAYQLQQRNRLLEDRVRRRTQDLAKANEDLSNSREEVLAQNEMLQSIQAELEAQNQEMVESRTLLASQNEQLHEMKLVLELKNQSLADANDRLEDLATIDGLTGLKNHRSFQVKLDTEIKFSARHNTPLSLIILDVDSFKSFNDTYGHPAGDEVLKQVARILADTARDTDFVARYGGEEFVVILPVTDTDGAVGVAERMREAIEEWPWTVRPITASFGVAPLSLDVEGAPDFVNRADQALYTSKKTGKNRVTTYTAMATRLIA